jgi:cysteine-rich repeat protein
MKLAKRKLSLVAVFLTVLAFTATIVNANTKESSTMWFQGQLTSMGGGTYSGVLPMIDEGATGMGDGISGYDIYGQEGATAWFGSAGPTWTSSVISNHDAWPTWNPDTPDWYQYSLELYQDGTGQYRWAVRNHPGATAQQPWYDPTNPKPPAGVPMSGTMDWTNMIAAETDTGAYLPGTGTALIPGGAATYGGGPQAWDMDWSWGSEVVPLECATFKVNIVDLGGGIYRVSLTPPSNTWYWKDYNGPQIPGGYMPDIDQNQDFDNSGPRIQETSSKITYSGQWTQYNVLGPSGGGIKCSNDTTTPGSATLTFNGSSIAWIEAMYTNRGISEVRIDGQLMTTVDAYGPLQWQQILYSSNSLSPGPHTITLKVSGEKNPASSDYYLCVDAFDVNPIEQEYCAPVAEANSLWWLDKTHGLGIFEFPYDGLGYIGGDVNGDGEADILDFIRHLAIFKKTNVDHTGTIIVQEQAGISDFLRMYELDDKLYEHTVYDTEYESCQEYFTYLEDEVKRCQDVKLDLGFWHVDEVYFDQGIWKVRWSRKGGHAVTVAGVDSQNNLFAISDPDNDAVEAGLNPGFVRAPIGATHPYPHEPFLHNNENFASHDIYTVGPSPSPGGKCGLLNYPFKWNFPENEWKTVVQDWGPEPPPLEYCMTFTEIEAAVIVSPIICGNGVADPGEECDDGNLINGDGCDDQCKIPDISVPSSVDFKQVIVGGSSASQTVTVSNTGNGKLTIGTITLGGTNADQFSIETDNCSGQLIAPSGNCTVDVKFSPTSLNKKATTLDIPSDDPDDNPLSVSLIGKGAKVDVISPNGGEVWKVGTTQAITWQTKAGLPVAKVKLFYTTTGGAPWNLIKTITGNPGTYNWKVPAAASIKCKVKVILKNASGKTIGQDVSDNFFSIGPQ